MVKGRDIGLVGDMSAPETIGRLIEDFFGDTTRLSTWKRNVSFVRNDVCWEVEGQKLVAIYDAL